MGACAPTVRLVGVCGDHSQERQHGGVQIAAKGVGVQREAGSADSGRAHGVFPESCGGAFGCGAVGFEACFATGFFRGVCFGADALGGLLLGGPLDFDLRFAPVAFLLFCVRLDEVRLDEVRFDEVPAAARTRFDADADDRFTTVEASSGSALRLDSGSGIPDFVRSLSASGRLTVVR